MARSKIEWLARLGTIPESWNPVSGCDPDDGHQSEACVNCWARRMSKRLAGRHGYPRNEAICPICGESYDRVEPFCPEHPNATLTRTSSFDVTLHPDKLDQPLHWKKPRTVFTVSMGDLFHEDVERKWIVTVFAIMALAQRHTFIVLTKRAERMHNLLTDKAFWRDVEATAIIYALQRGVDLPSENFTEIRNIKVPLSNIWGLVTAETQKQLDARVPILLQCPFVVRGVSVEPMLGPVDLENYLGIWTNGYYPPYQSMTLERGPTPYLFTALAKPAGATLYKKELDWIILGPETGPGAREMSLDGARQVRDQCIAAGVPFFFKRGLLDGQEWHQWPS